MAAILLNHPRSPNWPHPSQKPRNGGKNIPKVLHSLRQRQPRRKAIPGLGFKFQKAILPKTVLEGSAANRVKKRKLGHPKQPNKLPVLDNKKAVPTRSVHDRILLGPALQLDPASAMLQQQHLADPLQGWSNLIHPSRIRPNHVTTSSINPRSHRNGSLVPRL